MKKIYVASSWRNQDQPQIVRFLRDLGHEVYDFRHPAEKTGFQWSQIDEDWKSWSTHQYIKALEHPIAQAGFNSDFNAMQWADVCVLVSPCGRSAHSEAGWMKGAGKKVIVYQLCEEEPELMYKLFDGICSSGEGLRLFLEAFEKERQTIEAQKEIPEKWKGVSTYNPNFPDGAIMIKVNDNIARPVAIVPFPVGGHKKGTEIQLSNASLIASAPELLNACEDALTYFSPDECVYDTLADAIIKAKIQHFE